MSFGILGHSQQMKQSLDNNLYGAARNQKKRQLDSFQAEQGIKAGYVQSGMTGAGYGASIGASVGGAPGALAGAVIGGVGGFLADFFL
jgi:outer membrane lipoprotein SlyB